MHKQMSSSSVFFCTLTVLSTLFSSPVQAIVSFKVGDSEGWHNPGSNETETFIQWTATKKFHVSDSLRFEYTNDSVLVVDKWAYYHCDTTKPSFTYNDGNTTLVLDNPGKFFFISGEPQHCEEGQRFFINVFALPSSADSPAPSPAITAGSSAVSLNMVSPLVSVSVASLALAWLAI